MFRLMVSRNCGISYAEEAIANDVMDFAELCRNLDDDLFRWTIADEAGKDIIEDRFMCRVFREMFGVLGHKTEAVAFYEEGDGEQE